MKEDVVGVCIGEASPMEASFISKHMPSAGEYVILKYEGQEVLGMIEALTRGSTSISSDIIDPEAVERILLIEGEDSHYIRGRVRILGRSRDLEMPRIPPPPGTRINKADKETLSRIFTTGPVRIGRLLNHPEVEVGLDANKMIARHLAILAITGAGKSNTVSVIVEELVRLQGMPIIFDMHSEYAEAGFTKTNRITPSLNPIYLSFEEFKLLVDIGRDAYIQERYLRKAYKTAKDKLKQKGNFLKKIITNLEETSEGEGLTSSEKNAIAGVINKVEDFEHRYEGLVDTHAPYLLNQLQQGTANVVDLGQVDEDYADVIVSHILRKALYKRKKDEIPPAFCILEEAHILAPAKRPTYSKYWIDRIAREGRKFGLGLCLVSQRPKSLDQNSLSQANNTIIMRMVEPSDQRHVQQASERLSDDLLEQLNSLNTGEAIILGMMTRIPALIKIHKFKGKTKGTDPDIIGQWQKEAKKRETEHKEKTKEITDLYSTII